MKLQTKTALLFLLFSCCIHFTAAQSWQVTGRVIDILTREPVVNAYITAGNDTGFAFSDLNGNYSIRLTPRTTELTVLADGYIKATVPVRSIRNLIVLFELTASASQLAAKARKEGERPVDWYVQKIIDNKDNNEAEHNAYYSYHSYEKMELDMTDVSEELMKKKIMKPFAFMFDMADTVSTNAKPYLPFFFSEKPEGE